MDGLQDPEQRGGAERDMHACRRGRGRGRLRCHVDRDASRLGLARGGEDKSLKVLAWAVSYSLLRK